MITKPIRFLLELADAPRRVKGQIVLALDTALVLIGLYTVLALRFEDPAFLNRAPQGYTALFAAMAVATPASLILLQIPRIKLGTLEGRAILRIVFAAGILGLILIAAGALLQVLVPRSVPFAFAALFFASALMMRVAGVQLVTHAADHDGAADRVAIYGAGAAGIQLASSLRQSRELRPVFFVDDDPKLRGVMVAGLPVFAPNLLREKLDRHQLAHVLLAMPSAPPHRVKAIADAVGSLGVEVRSLPSYVDIIARNEGIGLRTVEPGELLGRGVVNLDAPDIASTYAGRGVMVTGAGGSIGSELCRQLLECRPVRIVLFEQSEYALYAIHHELAPLAEASGIGLVARLGSVNDHARVESVLLQERVDTILHAAAYKHVPMVEDNEIEGARTNVLGTRTVALAALAANVERFVLISTDKAVRPTNVMGATKRLAELVIQDLATRSAETKFSMVRFGNVLGSSGSVLPLFQRQIQAGGPVTVTDPEVTRFFMTIPEAARLVLLAGSYARGGDVFVLDMGQPVKIIDVARRMIELSGRRVYDPATGSGDIRIEITGLRPGEKRYEELLIDHDNLRDTPHPKILRAEEHMLSEIEIKAIIREIEAAIEHQNPDRVRKVIEARVDGYRRPDHAAVQIAAGRGCELPPAALPA
ncbi:nucleoside-diphosphate sugar epimerase/dehydratase [Maritimibacter sp. HL-12]|uniref:polysaccharide biosynthesis protein n=1 Tax=Maritimibacter sp. HL-12 TaxID=1162418 RepID=UPI000A0F3ED3|nr:nucleoside-diphosphate sugar epimerase/dehydratase [Maritimibacter sp. HL-12]SMH54679.1 NDP-sugar epimerase, includes UDP-GlcNAc-inverting 4,6-dehydratase FlaA1 and capsular polysaccharide biosynthesis protein EpsC [Maritimibacter sp. HL-12]